MLCFYLDGSVKLMESIGFNPFHFCNWKWKFDFHFVFELEYSSKSQRQTPIGSDQFSMI